MFLWLAGHIADTLQTLFLKLPVFLLLREELELLLS